MYLIPTGPALFRGFSNFSMQVRSQLWFPLPSYPTSYSFAVRHYKELYASYLRTAMDYALERTSREFWQSSIDVYGERWPQVSATFSAFAELMGAHAAREQRDEAVNAAAAANERSVQAEQRAESARCMLVEHEAERSANAVLASEIDFGKVVVRN
jgi:hypothetical protein